MIPKFGRGMQRVMRKWLCVIQEEWLFRIVINELQGFLREFLCQCVLIRGRFDLYLFITENIIRLHIIAIECSKKEIKPEIVRKKWVMIA